ncbi:MAG: hypothetical protein GF315_15020 [candidate division Zixibacteria bacterium]|nr:hypothetical protein [candidate division Zixibacteria bacterium]
MSGITKQVKTKPSQKYDRLSGFSSLGMNSHILAGIIATGMGIVFLAVSLLFASEVIVAALVLMAIAVVVILKWPVVGLIGFVIISFIRPADIMPSLAAIPLAKLIGGGTFLAVLLKHIRSKDILFQYKQTYLLATLTIILFVSVPLSYWPSRSLEISMDFTKILIFFLIFINIVRDLKTLRVVSLVAVACMCILCYSTIQSYLDGSLRAAATIGAGLYGDSNDVALMLVTSIPLVGFVKFNQKRMITANFLYWGIVLFLSAGVIVTESRGGLLGLIAVLMLTFMRGRNKLKGILILLIVGLLAIPFLPAEISERYKTIGEYGDDPSAMNRLYAWQAGLDMMISRPLYGVGIGAFETAFGTAYKPDGFNSARWMAPHNTLVQIGAETGIVGLFIFLYLYIFCMLQLKRIRIRQTGINYQRLAQTRDIIFTGFVGFAICAFFLTQALNYILYFLIASTVCLHNINSFRNQTTDTNK